MNFIANKINRLKNKGESLWDIFLYWLPELISATLLISLPPIIDSWIITRLGSTTIYGALGMGTNFLHTLIKLAEAIPVASIAIIGRYNGAKEYTKCGEGLGDTFWTTFILGFAQFVIIFLSAHHIYRWLDVPDAMIAFGAPFIQVKSFGVFLIFLALSLLGFMRAVKNTRVPMMLNLIGIVTFIFFDYTLVLGSLGFPKMGLMGSALATIIQYSVINIIALLYIITNPDYKKYFSHMFFAIFSVKRSLHILSLSWPIIIDKSTMSFSYVWLSKMLAPLGKYAITTFDVIKNLERFAILPVTASAVIITFLVSNRLGAEDNEGAMANIKKVFIFTSCLVIPALMILAFNAPYFISFFDPKNEFTTFASAILPIVSFLVILDFTQVILAGALRGAGDVKAVMWGRFSTCICFFVPVSYALSKIPNIQGSTKFLLVYGSLYITTGIMGILFFSRIKGRKWQKREI